MNDIDLDRIHFTIISHNRSENVKKIEEITGIGNQLTWYVGKHEKQDYKHAQGNVIASGGLVDSRNAALDSAMYSNRYCFMLEDDLVKCQMFNSTKQAIDISFLQAVQEMYNILQGMPVYLAGIAPTNNNLFYDTNKPIGLKHYIIGSFILIKPKCRLRFDKQFRLKEDYDFTLQHIRAYGGVCRLNYLIPKFLHYKNKGGAVDYRTDDLEQSTIKKLKKKWGNTIRDNPRRKNEVLLHVG